MFIIDPFRFGPPSLDTYLIVARNYASASGIYLYPFTPLGYGSRIDNPGTFLYNAKSVRFSKNGQYVAIGSDASPYIYTYPFASGVFGALFSSPATIPTSQVDAVCFSPSSDAVVFGSRITPYVYAYPWSSGGYGTKYADPATLPTGSATSLAFNPAGTVLFVGSGGAPRLAAYHWASGFGAKYPDFSPLPGSSITGVDVHSDGSLVTACSSGGGLYLIPWNDSTGWGTSFTTITGLTSATAVKFHPLGDYVAISFGATPYVRVYPFSRVTGFGTPMAPSTVPAGAASSLDWSSDGAFLSVGHSGSPFVSTYPFSGGALGARVANPAPNPGQALAIDFL